MADLMKLMFSSWNVYSKAEQQHFIAVNFNRKQRRKFAKDGDLNDLFKFYR